VKSLKYGMGPTLIVVASLGTSSVEQDSRFLLEQVKVVSSRGSPRAPPESRSAPRRAKYLAVQATSVSRPEVRAVRPTVWKKSLR
jgi:hypothetical protein